MDFMNSNPHEGHALNEVWFVALVAACTPNVKLATMKYRVFVLSRIQHFPCNLLNKHDKSLHQPMSMAILLVFAKYACDVV